MIESRWEFLFQMCNQANESPLFEIFWLVVCQDLNMTASCYRANLLVESHTIYLFAGEALLLFVFIRI